MRARGVDIKARGPDDPHPVLIIQARDWTRIPAAELFRRLYPKQEASHLDRVILEGYERLFTENAADLHNADGDIIGRAMLVSGMELVDPDLRWMKVPEAFTYVGGLLADEIYYSWGCSTGGRLPQTGSKHSP